jgi:hypothetical protein
MLLSSKELNKTICLFRAYAMYNVHLTLQIFEGNDFETRDMVYELKIESRYKFTYDDEQPSTMNQK